jgi:hypothetical protein
VQHVFVVRFHFIVEIGERFVGCVCVNWTIFAVSMFFVQVFCRLLLLSLGHCVVRLSVEMNAGYVYMCRMLILKYRLELLES